MNIALDKIMQFIQVARQIIAGDILQELSYALTTENNEILASLHTTLQSMHLDYYYVKKFKVINEILLATITDELGGQVKFIDEETLKKYIHLENLAQRSEKEAYITSSWQPNARPRMAVRVHIKALLGKHQLSMADFKGADLHEFTSEGFKEKACSQAAYEAYVMSIIVAVKLLSLANNMLDKELTSIDIITMVHDTAIEIWGPSLKMTSSQKNKLSLLHSFYPENANKRAFIYYSASDDDLGHYEALIPFNGTSLIDYSQVGDSRAEDLSGLALDQAAFTRIYGIDHEAFWPKWKLGDFTNLSLDIISEMSLADMETLQIALKNPNIDWIFERYLKSHPIGMALNAAFHDRLEFLMTSQRIAVTVFQY